MCVVGKNYRLQDIQLEKSVEATCLPASLPAMLRAAKRPASLKGFGVFRLPELVILRFLSRPCKLKRRNLSNSCVPPWRDAVRRGATTFA